MYIVLVNACGRPVSSVYCCVLCADSADEGRLHAGRYRSLDASAGGTEGVWAEQLEFLVPEFAGNPLVRLLVRGFARNNRVYMDQFFQLLATLSPKAPTTAKRDGNHTLLISTLFLLLSRFLLPSPFTLPLLEPNYAHKTCAI